MPEERILGMKNGPMHCRGFPIPCVTGLKSAEKGWLSRHCRAVHAHGNNRVA